MIELFNYNHSHIFASFNFEEAKILNDEIRKINKLDLYKNNILVFDNVEEKTITFSHLFSEDLAGLHKKTNILYNCNDVYDNTKYYMDRIYLNSECQHFNTLYEKIICEEILVRYKKAVDQDKLKTLIKDFKIYKEFEKDKLTKLGKVLFAFALGLSCYSNIIMYINLDKEILDLLIDIDILEYINNNSFGITLIINCNADFNQDKLKQYLNHKKIMDYVHFLKIKEVKQ